MKNSIEDVALVALHALLSGISSRLVIDAIDSVGLVDVAINYAKEFRKQIDKLEIKENKND
jgi:hypothetical protein